MNINCVPGLSLRSYWIGKFAPARLMTTLNREPQMDNTAKSAETKPRTSKKKAPLRVTR